VSQTGGSYDADIDAPEAWGVLNELAGGTEEIVVAVLDTGIDYNHPDLTANMWTSLEGYHGYDFVNGDNDPMDDHYHGTHVAGIIAAAGNNGVGVAGVSWTAKLMAVKILDEDLSGDLVDAAEAVNYVTLMREQGVNVR